MFAVFGYNANTLKMQIQIISTYDEMQNAFSQMFAEAIKSIPVKDPANAPYIISGDELKSQLGVTIQTIIRWRNKGKIPYLQIGSSIRYDLNKVLEALQVNKKKGAIK